MNILEVIGQLRPGTAWNQMFDGTIVQAEDGTPRVTIPTDEEIQAFMAATPDPIDQIKTKIKDTTAPLHERFNALVLFLGLGGS